MRVGHERTIEMPLETNIEINLCIHKQGGCRVDDADDK